MLCLRSILAILLAIQVINPMCCCTLRAEDSPSCCQATPTPAPASSCCSRTSMADEIDAAGDNAVTSENPPSSGDRHLCMCAPSQEYTEHAKTTIPCFKAATLPEPVYIELLNPLSLVTTLAPAPTKGEHPPPGLPLRLRYSIFRL